MVEVVLLGINLHMINDSTPIAELIGNKTTPTLDLLFPGRLRTWLIMMSYLLAILSPGHPPLESPKGRSGHSRLQQSRPHQGEHGTLSFRADRGRDGPDQCLGQRQKARLVLM